MKKAIAKFLVVDDDLDLAKILKGSLEKKEFQVTTVSKGKEALSLIRKQRPHLIFLDIGLPDISGMELLPRIKQINSSIKVIMITGFDEEETIKKAKALGADDYVIKPFTLRYLEETVLGKIYRQLFPDLRKSYDKRILQTIQMVVAFNKAVDARDPYTAEHSEEVCKIGIAIAKELNLPITQDLKFGLLLHDIGKIGIPDRVLLKRRKLTKKEFKIMKQHPMIGFEIVGVLGEFKRVAKIIYCHQERYDGKGYPKGLKGRDIPIEARIISVADAYHAMTSYRPYRKALSVRVAVKRLLKEKNKQFDPTAVDALIKILMTKKSII